MAIDYNDISFSIFPDHSQSFGGTPYPYGIGWTIRESIQDALGILSDSCDPKKEIDIDRIERSILAHLKMEGCNLDADYPTLAGLSDQEREEYFPEDCDETPECWIHCIIEIDYDDLRDF